MAAKRQSLFYITLFFVLALAQGVFAWNGRVVGIADGDTITVLHDSRPERIRLYGIDCPERRQAYGKKAQQFTAKRVYKQVVEVHPFDVDQYGNTVAIVRMKGSILNEELIRLGLAWVYTWYCNLGICRKWEGLMSEARSSRRGLWADRNPIPPWAYREEKAR